MKVSHEIRAFTGVGRTEKEGRRREAKKKGILKGRGETSGRLDERYWKGKGLLLRIWFSSPRKKIG